ncbi:MAG: phosphomannomutase/phosphoglucomutase [Bryobacteraceae bacterium]|nr:phosphomannomutase/phosphoglucomutase [Bryobacteraceae bacterium]
MLKPTIFREYDIRGIADLDLQDDDIAVLGQAIGTFLQRANGRNVNLGRDCRLSSPRLSRAIANGLAASGCRVTDLGTVPTPVLYHSTMRMGADGAVMITGSHNPSEYNGFKILSGPATIFGEKIQEIRRLIEGGDLLTGEGSYREYDGISPYVDDIASRFRWDRRIKVVLDAGNGTAGPTMSRVLECLNVDATALYFEMDGNFPNHHPDPTLEENLDALVAAVKEQGAELGIAFDGDVDRIGAVDETGRVVWGDFLMLIFGREILTRKPNATFIAEVKCSQILYDELRRLGGNAIMYRTGHSLIKAKMKETHADLAGEMSGHMFFADRYYGYDDAIYAACRLMEIVANSGKPLSAQLEGLPQTVTTPEIRVDCSDEVKFELVSRVAERFRKTHNVVDVDGVRVLFPHGWGLVRASNTQPVLVLRFEALTREQLGEYRREIETALEEARAAAT